MYDDLISRSALKKAFEETVCIEPMPYAFVKQIIDNAPTVEPEPYFEKAEKDKRIYERGFEDGQNARPQGENKIIELFNKYDILLVHIDGKIVPVKNSTKQECYDLLYEIQEIIEWRKLLFNKHLSEVQNENND